METNHQQSQPRTVAKRLLYILLFATSLVIITHLVFQYLNLEVFYQQNGQIYELSNRFDLDDESSVPTWLAQFLFLAIAAAAWLSAYLQNQKRPRRLWTSIAVIGLLFSIDEISALHERLLQTIHVAFFQDNAATTADNAWLVLAPFIVLLAAYLLWMMWRILPKRTIGIFIFAGLVFVGGAMFVDLLANTSERETFLNQGLLVGLEESMELFGCVVALYAIVDYLERKYHTPIRQAIAKLKSGQA